MHFEREQKRIKYFENEVLDAEKVLTSRLELQVSISNKNSQELEELKLINIKLQHDSDSYLSELESQRTYNKELQEMSRNMIESLRMLEDQNKLYESIIRSYETDGMMTLSCLNEDPKRCTQVKNNKDYSNPNVPDGRCEELPSDAAIQCQPNADSDTDCIADEGKKDIKGNEDVRVGKEKKKEEDGGNPRNDKSLLCELEEQIAKIKHPSFY